jgi:hypothetical protein
MTAIILLCLCLAIQATANLGPLLVNDLYLPPPFNTAAVDGRTIQHDDVVVGGGRLAGMPGRPKPTGPTDIPPIIIKFPPRPPVFGLEQIDDQMMMMTVTTGTGTAMQVTSLVTLTTVNAKGQTVRVSGGLIPPTRASREDKVPRPPATMTSKTV